MDEESKQLPAVGQPMPADGAIAVGGNDKLALLRDIDAPRVARCAAMAQGVYTATMTSTLRATKSAASLGSTPMASADRNSKSRF
jgi:hypothetical protein